MTKAPLLSVLACALLTLGASAQVEVSVGRGRISGPAVPLVPFSATPGAPGLNSPMSGPALTPSLSAPSIVPLLSASPAKALSVLPAAAIEAAKPAAAVSPVVAAKTPASALSVLSVASAKLDGTFDGAVTRADNDDDVAAPAAAPRASFLGRAALAAGVFVAHPGIALASQAPVVVEPSALALVTDYGPVAVAITAVLGALFGLWSARSKDGSAANAGQALSGSLSSGAIAGAAAFTLLDLTKVAFLGATAAALTPLTAAVATAALAQAAFAAKFTDPATTPADRIIGAFPAVAMAFGLSVGAAAFLPATTMLTVGTAALMLTAAATALYTATYRQDKSVASGPAMMGRGFVLQSLMTGLAVALGPSPYALFFFALGLCGFGAVMLATGKEVWAAILSLRAPKKP